MRLNRSFWMAAVVTVGLCGAGQRASAASNPSSATYRVNCTTQACSSLIGSFAGRLDWYSGNVLLYSESGSFLALSGGDILITLSGNNNAFTFKATYEDPATSIFAGPDLNFQLFATAGGDNLLLAEAYQPHGSSLWAQHSEDSQAELARATGAEAAEKARAIAAEAVGNQALNLEVSKRSGGDTTLSIQLTNETTRATNAETNLQAQLDADTAARKAADTAETQRATAAETTLTNNLNSEIARAQNSEQTINSNMQGQIDSLNGTLTQEISDRTNGDTNLSNQLNNEVNRATNAEPSIVPAADAHTDARIVWPTTCPQGQVISSTGQGTWGCADLMAGGGAGCNPMTQTYNIAANQLVNANNGCGGQGGQFMCCNSDYGFNWTDTTNSNNIQSITVNFTEGVSCQSGARTTDMNGTPGDGYTEGYWCNCGAQGNAPSHTLNMPTAAYIAGGQNTFTIHQGYEEGFQEINGQYFGLVTVTYCAGGGGGNGNAGGSGTQQDPYTLNPLGASCLDYKNQLGNAQDGYYSINPNSPLTVYCDQTNNGGGWARCWNFTNTANADLTDNNYFSQCVDYSNAAWASKGNVQFTIHDNNDSVLYRAYGAKQGQWNYNQITSTTDPQDQYYSYNHNRLITLADNNKLMITGQNSANAGCGGSFGNGYGITIYPTNPDYYSNPLGLVMSDQQFNTYGGERYFSGWNASNELTWNGGNSFNTCSGVPAGTIGRFEFFVQ